MEITNAALNAIYTAISTRFRDAFASQADNSYLPFTMTETVGAGQLKMPMLAQLTGMREWVGERVVNALSVDPLTVIPRDFELTYGIPANAIKDDEYGVFGTLFAQMGAQAANLPIDLVTELLNKAAEAVWCDDAKFFGTTRKYGKSVISNTTTEELSVASLQTAYSTMRAYKGHGNTPLKVAPSILVHGPALTWTAKELLDNPQRIENGVAIPNLFHNLVKRVEISGLEGNKWFLFAAGGVYRPVCYFEREAPSRLVRKDRLEDDNVFDTNEYLYGVSGRAAAAFVLPHLAYFGNPA